MSQPLLRLEEPNGSDAYEFVRNTIKNEFESFTTAGATKIKDKTHASWDDLLEWVSIAKSDQKKREVSETAVKAAFSQFYKITYNNARFDAIQAPLAFSGHSDLVEQFVKALTGRVDEKDVAQVKHFIWQVKRKLLGLKVEHHMMLMIYGPQGVGKSEAIRALLKPVQCVTQSADLSWLDKEKHFFRLAENYVFFVDEAAKIRGVDVASFKRVITAEDPLAYRKLGVNVAKVAIQNGTFISTANVPACDLIADTGGARRLWQIDVEQKCDWAAINDLDYVALWRSVDPYAHCYLLPHLEEIQKKQQAEFKFMSAEELWLASDCEIPSNPANIYTPHQYTLGSVLYKAFKKWTEGHDNNNTTSYRQFGITMTSLARIGVKKKQDDDGLTAYSVILKPKLAPKDQEYGQKHRPNLPGNAFSRGGSN